MRELDKQENRLSNKFPRVVVCGTRTFTDWKFLYKELDRLTKKLDRPVIVTGAAKGADQFAENWANERRLVNVRYHAQWQKYGAKAGPIRNSEMLEETIALRKPAFLVAFHDGKSKGTADAIVKAKKLGYKVQVIRYRG